MVEIGELLREVASDAPTGGPRPGLYDRAARARRRTRLELATGIAAAAVAVLVGIGLAGLAHRDAQADLRPAGSGMRAGIPNQVFTPSKYLPGTAGHPLGQLAMILSATRSGPHGSSRAWVGISAVTGEYRFLDLPGFADPGGGFANDPQLSPDGKHIAYWFAGRLSGDPASERPIVALAIYDTTTGAVTRTDLTTAHGLSPQLLTWTEDNVVVFGTVQCIGNTDFPDQPFADDCSAGMGPTRYRVWKLSDPAPSPIDLNEDTDLGDSPGPGLIAVLRHGAATAFTSPDDVSGRDLQVINLAEFSSQSDPIIDASHTRIAQLYGRLHGQLRVGVLPAPGGRIRWREVAGPRFSLPLAWTDKSHVVLGEQVTDAADGHNRVVQVDVRTGESLTLMEASPFSITVDQAARDLWSQPTVPGVQPPDPWSPRKELGLAIGVGTILVVCLLGLGLALVSRRRVRP